MKNWRMGRQPPEPLLRSMRSGHSHILCSTLGVRA
jgi:hypothetical protein